MKYNIHVTQAAERDMANAYDYIDLVLKNPTVADKLLDVADEKIGALAEFPHKFEVVSDKLLSLWGIRFHRYELPCVLYGGRCHANRAYRAVSLRQKQLDHHSENRGSKRQFADVLITEYFIWALTFVGAFLFRRTVCLTIILLQF